MTANSIRSFAIGLIVATSVCGAVYYSGPTEGKTEKIVEKPSAIEMKNELTSEGYFIFTEKEWQDELVSAKAIIKDNKDVESKETIIYRTMLTVSQGMTSIDVGKALEQANIIDSATDFFNAVEKRDLSKHLRPGTYEVESGMTLNEIIDTIFK